MNRLIALAIVLSVITLARFRFSDGVVFENARSTLSFGFLLLAAYLGADLLSRFRIPKITGYILAGILFGPFGFGFVSTATVGELKLIDDLALTFIAFAAGGEMRLDELRPRLRSISWTVVALVVSTVLGVGTFVVLASSLFPYVDPDQSIQIIVVAAVIGAFSVARSPSSAIAIISECKARGPFTETTLGVTVATDLIAIMLFAVVVAFGQALVGSSAAMDYGFVGLAVAEVASSIACGIALGALVSQYIHRVRADLAIFILTMAFMVTFFSRQSATLLDELYRVRFHLEPMLICVTAGFWVQNFSRNGEPLMEQIDRSSLPIYVVFFALTGAALDIDSLRTSWAIALLLASVRFASIWCGAYVGARLSGDPPLFARLSGLAYVTQAGVSLGLAGIVIRRFPEWGAELATTLVAVIALNQIFGPVAMKYALGATGEARSKAAR